MKVLLRHNRTGHFYKGNYEWVANLGDAGDFESLETALQLISQDHLDGMSMIIQYNESNTQVFNLEKDQGINENITRITNWTSRINE